MEGRNAPKTAEHKARIGESMRGKNRGAKSAEHKARLSRSVRESKRGAVQRCGACGQEGHNRRQCPSLRTARATGRASVLLAPSVEARSTLCCSVCGREGHNRRTCPEAEKLLLVAAGEAAGAAEGTAGGGSGMATLYSTDLLESTAAGREEDLFAYPPLPGELAAGGGQRKGSGVGVGGGGEDVGDAFPKTFEEVVRVAGGALRRALDEDEVRLTVTVPLPLQGPGSNFDYPGGSRQQFKVAVPGAELLLRSAGLDPAAFSRRILDEEDAVALWEGPDMDLVIFATADTLPALERDYGLSLAGRVRAAGSRGALARRKPLVLLNPYYYEGEFVGSPLSAFSRSVRAVGAFVASFTPVYFLASKRIRGCELQVLRSFPGAWRIYEVVEERRVEDGTVKTGYATRLIHETNERPGYWALDRIVQDQGLENGFLQRFFKAV